MGDKAPFPPLIDRTGSYSRDLVFGPLLKEMTQNLEGQIEWDQFKKLTLKQQLQIEDASEAGDGWAGGV